VSGLAAVAVGAAEPGSLPGVGPTPAAELFVSSAWVKGVSGTSQLIWFPETLQVGIVAGTSPTTTVNSSGWTKVPLAVPNNVGAPAKAIGNVMYNNVTTKLQFETVFAPVSLDTAPLASGPWAYKFAEPPSDELALPCSFRRPTKSLVRRLLGL